MIKYKDLSVVLKCLVWYTLINIFFDLVGIVGFIYVWWFL